MQEERVLVGRRIRKVPGLLVQEAVVLRVNAHACIEGDIHVVRRFHPIGDFRNVEPGPIHQCRKPLRVFLPQALDRPGGIPQVLARHEIRIGIVIHDGVVFIRSRYPMDAKLAPLPFRIESQIRPQTRRFYQQLGPDLMEKLLVAGDIDVLFQGVDDVGIDVILGRAGRIIR